MSLTKQTNPISFILITLLLLTIVQNCSSSVDPIDDKTNLDTLYSSSHFLWPAKLSNFWEFTRYRFVQNNLDKNWNYDNFTSFGFNLDTIKNKYSYKLQVVDTLNVTLSDTIFSAHVFDSFIDRNYSEWLHPYWIGVEGVFNLGIILDQDLLFKKGLFLPRKLFVNKKWKGYFFGMREGKLESVITDNECLSNSEKLTTFSGEFQCYVIRTRFLESNDYPGFVDIYKYYNPKIGLVAQVKLFSVPDRYWNVEYVDVLNNYHINN